MGNCVILDNIMGPASFDRGKGILKKIFEEVTGIRVVIESGNMKKNYGKELNAVLIRTVQKAFTNAVRHGRATRIDILFWEFPDYLSKIGRAHV